MKNALNKLVLGTAQFGLDYGINNPNGKPAREAALAMLDFAYESGIRIFDTAFAYGNAEEILGEFSQSRNLGEKIKIITKSKPNIILRGPKGCPAKTDDIIAGNLKESLKRLKRNYVDGYLLHTPSHIRDKETVDSLCKLKKQGLVKNIGVSIYEEEDAIYAARLDGVDYIQIPYSIFDQRLDKTDFFQLARKNNKKIFARSVFFQGLFLMPEEKILSDMQNIKPYLKELDKIIAKHGLSRKEAALLFPLKNKNIDYVVFGVDNIKQLKENIDIAKKNIDCEECIKELKDKFISIGENIKFPGSWKK